MALPFDLEDIVGYALADLIRRVALFAACLVGAPLLTAFALAMADAVGSLRITRFWDDLHWEAFELFLIPVTTMWGILYVPALISIGCYFAKSETPGIKYFVAFVGLLCLLMILSLRDFEGEEIGALVIIAGILGFFLWCACWWGNKRRVLGEQHLMTVAIENEERRHQVRQEFGTDVAEGDFVTNDPGDDSPH